VGAYDEIAKIAYEFYEKSGSADGPTLDMWLKAEKIVMARYREQGTARGKLPAPPEEKPLPAETGMPTV
jgi:hypothetical protein